MIVNLFVFIIGTMVGSFLNVCIYRLPKEKSIVFPSSHCPKCNAPIRPINNVPLISYVFLLGKCQSCKKNISPRYPIVELLTGLAFLAVRLKAPAPIDFFFLALFVSLLIIGFFSDLEEMIIPDEIIVVGLAAGLVFNYLKGDAANAMLAAATGYAVFYVIGKVSTFIAKKDALGFGDVKLAAMLGAFLGPAGFWNTFFIAYLSGAVISIPLLLSGAKKREDYIPFGPFLITGAVITLFWGPQLIVAIF